MESKFASNTKIKTSKANPFEREGGFTLIEMLVVVAVIGLLSSAVIVGLDDARSRARDARRIADIRQIQNGLEAYYSGTQSYPRDVYDAVDGIPGDPQGGYYTYMREGSQGYILGTCLENDRPSGVSTFNSNEEVGTIDSPMIPPPEKCLCSDSNGYCVSIGVDE